MDNNTNINEDIKLFLELYNIYNNILCVQTTDEYALSIYNNTKNNLKNVLNILGVEV